MKKGNVSTDLTEIKWIIREYCEQLYANTLDNLDDMDKFLSKLTQKENDNLNKPI